MTYCVGVLLKDGIVLGSDSRTHAGVDNFASTPYVLQYQLPFVDVRDTTAATLEQGEQRPCGDIGATVWYEFVSPPLDVALSVDTAGSDFNTVLAVYTLTAIVPSPPGGLTLISCVDDAGGPLARLQFAAKANTTYYIQAGGAAGATGLLKIALDCTPACPPPNVTSGGQGGGCCIGPDSAFSGTSPKPMMWRTTSGAS